MEKTAELLAKVDFLDIYDEIAEIPINNEQIINMCIKVPCKVDLRKVNLVYLVEQKYKSKLSTYDKRKALKWLQINLPRLLPNPEVKYLSWHDRHQRKEKIDWIKRKAYAIQQLPPPITGSQSISQIEYDDTTQQTNSTAASVETVIPSQKTLDQIMPGFSNLMKASYTSVESNDLPEAFNVTSTQDFYEETVRTTPRIIQNMKPNQEHPQFSEGFSSQDDCFTLFYSENMVTSTQEFD